MSLLIKPNDIQSFVVESNSYDPYTDITLVESPDPNIKFYVKNIVVSNVGGSNIDVTLKLKNNIIISKTLVPNEYFNYTPEIIVTSDNPLKVNIGPQPNGDVSVLYMEKVEVVSDTSS